MLLFKFKLWKIKISNGTWIYNICIKYKSIVSLHETLGLCIEDKIRFRTSKSFSFAQVEFGALLLAQICIKFFGRCFFFRRSVLHKLEFSIPETAWPFVVSTCGLEAKKYPHKSHCEQNSQRSISLAHVARKKEVVKVISIKIHYYSLVEWDF